VTAHVRDLIHRSLEEELLPVERARLDAHLSACAPCAALSVELRSNDALLSAREQLPALPAKRLREYDHFPAAGVMAVGVVVALLAVALGSMLGDFRRGGTAAPTPGSPAATGSAGQVLAPAPSPVRVGPDARACAVAASNGAYLAAFGASPTDRTGLQGTPCLLYTSADGQRWERAPIEPGPAVSAPGIGGESVHVVGINPATGALFAGTTNGRILRAERLGEPWRSVFEPPAGTFQPVVLGFAFDGRRAYASMKGLLVSDDDGRSWRDSSVGIGTLRPGLETRGRFGTSAPVRSMNEIFLGIGGVIEGTTGMWATPDGGKTWRKVEALGTGEVGIAARDGLIALARQYPMDPTGSPLIPAQVSWDGGRTWMDTATLPRGVSIISLTTGDAFHPVIAGTTDGVYLLARDLSWTRLAVEPGTVGAITLTGARVYAAGQNGLWRIDLPQVEAAYPGTLVELVDENTVRVRLESAALSQEFGNPVLLRAQTSTEIVPPAPSIGATAVKAGDRVSVSFLRDTPDPGTGAYSLTSFRVLMRAP
jgi:hypothetical protein